MAEDNFDLLTEEEGGEEEKPELQFEPGELASFPLSNYPPAELSTAAKNALQELCHLASKKDLAARRWEINQSWEALDINELIPTPTGFKLMGNLCDGDYVLDGDGRITSVLKAHPLTLEQSYRLTFSNGATVIAGAHHKWRVSNVRDPLLLLTSQQIFESSEKYFICPLPALHLPETEMLVDPYLLGCWLGDGFTGNGSICGNQEDLQEISKYVGGTIIRKVSRAYGTYCVLSIPGLQRNLLRLGIRDEKRIPRVYLRASEEQRRELLRGLMDTDGWSRNEGALGWGQFKGRLALLEDVSELLSTLGIKHQFHAYTRERDGKEFVFHQSTFFAPFHCFKLPRKLSRQRIVAKDARAGKLYISKVEPVGEKTVRCISVASKDGMFLCGSSFIPTHNSRLFDRGYQHLWPRKNGGWLIPPASTPITSGQRSISGFPSHGRETNIVGAYGEIITAALTRDIPNVRFQPANPESDADITAADRATKYAQLFKRSNDLLDFQHQMTYYLRTDGRVTIVVDHIVDAQRFGREEEDQENPVVPETEESRERTYVAYVIRHGETKLNEEEKLRGRSQIGLNEQGERDIRHTAEWLKNKGIQKLVSSPVKRAFDSAENISRVLALPAFEVDDRFASLDLGELAGQETDATQHQIKDYFEKGNESFPGGESPDDFRKRVSEGLMAALQDSQALVGIVTHDSVIAQIFKTFQGEHVPSSQMMEPGGVAGIYQDQDGSLAIECVYPFLRPESSVSQTRGKPRGQEIVTPYGKLESKVPINAQSIEECPFVQVSREFDVSTLKARYPKFADKIQPGPSGAGEVELDRIARINTMIALESSYVTGDSMTLDATEQKTWMRPSWFMNAKDKEARQELLENFPDGCLVIYAGECQVLARNESMDDHVGVWNAFPGSGMNRMGLISKLMSVQRKLNDWIELMDLYFRGTVPQKHMNSDVYNLEAIRSQPNIPGGIIPFTLAKVPQQHVKEDLVFVEPTPTHQPAMPDFIKLFLVDLPQLISHALPSLFGAESNQDTATGQMLQRDQALETMGTPWHTIQQATCRYFRQAVQLAARCRQKPILGTSSSGEAVKIELSELMGSVLTFPEQDANFPESWNQRQARYQMMILDATTNPFITKLLTAPANLKMARDLGGLSALKIPEADAYEKQQGELDELLKTAPLPNPDKQKLQEHFNQISANVKNLAAQGLDIMPEEQQAINQMAQQLQAMPDFISTVSVEEEDLHAVEYQAILDFINSPEGRRLKNGTPEEKSGFENARIHGREHKAKIQSPEPEMKPPSTSIAFKDLPPEAAAALLKHQGLPSTPEAVAQAQSQTE